jgi:hypothetical protein
MILLNTHITCTLVESHFKSFQTLKLSSEFSIRKVFYGCLPFPAQEALLSFSRPPPSEMLRTGSSSELLPKYCATCEMLCKEAGGFHVEAKDVKVDSTWDGALTFAVPVLAMDFFPCAVGLGFSLILLSSFCSTSESLL